MAAAEMVERVARALAFAAGDKICGPDDGAFLERYAELHWRDHFTAAQSAIGAMLAPTAAMASAGGIGAEDAARCWRRMVDAALTERP